MDDSMLQVCSVLRVCQQDYRKPVQSFIATNFHNRSSMVLGLCH